MFVPFPVQQGPVSLGDRNREFSPRRRRDSRTPRRHRHHRRDHHRAGPALLGEHRPAAAHLPGADL